MLRRFSRRERQRLQGGEHLGGPIDEKHFRVLGLHVLPAAAAFGRRGSMRSHVQGEVGNAISLINCFLFVFKTNIM